MLQTFTTFAQDYSYYSVSNGSTDGGEWGAFFTAYVIFLLIFMIPAIAGLWKIFEKAGEPGWAAVVPIYNVVVYLRVVGRPVWWIAIFLLAFIPFVGVIVSIILGIILANDMAKSFGKDVGYTVLLFLVPFVGYPLLGFGKDEYKGPAAIAAGNNDEHRPAGPPTKHRM